MKRRQRKKAAKKLFLGEQGGTSWKDVRPRLTWRERTYLLKLLERTQEALTKLAELDRLKRLGS